ncbi:MAG TPA: hypothetical protein VF121_16905 [Thermoanaerobaculia bacterium]|nr:hypothetical protein [Thermoanaerobaculia bacterium]
MSPASAVLTVSGVLFGFLFAAFWWSLNREIAFKAEERHLKLGHLLLLGTLGLLGYFGIIVPLGLLAAEQQALRMPYRGVVLALIGIYGYTLTEFGHYSVFQRAKYRTPLEWAFFSLTLLAMAGVVLDWMVRQ